MAVWTPSRRRFLKTTALATGATLAAPYVKTAYTAGKVSLGLWDHWVPGANAVMKQLAEDWGKKNNVEVTIDFITSVGDKDMVTSAAESRAKTGHDVLSHRIWQVAVYQNELEPMDDVIAEMEKRYGPYTKTAAYLARFDNTWRGIVAPTGSHSYPMVSRLDFWKQHAGVDLKDLFPAGQRDQAKVDQEWTYANFLEWAKKLHAAGHEFGNPIGQTNDSQVWLAPLFLAFGSQPMNPNGDITIDSDETRAAIEYMRQLTQYMPPEVYAWDDAGNNRWLISGRGSSIQNPPSAWAVAVRDAPAVGSQCWHHDVPSGPKGRYRGSVPWFWGIWQFSQNKSAAKELILYLVDKPQFDKLIHAARGYDLPLQPTFYDNPVWESEGPPPGTEYNYPLRGNETLIVAGYPAAPTVAARIYTEGLLPVMVAKVTQGGESVNDAIAWASGELEGYLRG
jgi:hypothetical protein